jgi:hypothetical protein
MTALEGATLPLRTVLASHVTLQLVDRRSLRPPDDVERNGLMRVAAQAPDLEIPEARVKSIAESSGPL